MSKTQGYDMGAATRTEVLPLFAHRNDPITSYEAAEKAEKSVQHWHDRIIGVLRRYEEAGIDAVDGQTTKEIAYLLADGQDWRTVYNAVARRMKELRETNPPKIYAVGERQSKIGGGNLTAYRIKQETSKLF